MYALFFQYFKLMCVFLVLLCFIFFTRMQIFSFQTFGFATFFLHGPLTTNLKSLISSLTPAFSLM